MDNREIARILQEIGEYLDMVGEEFKPRAYEKAGEAVANLDEEAEAIYRRGGKKALEGIPGVGESIAEKIEELIKTGRLGYYEKLKKKTPVDLAGLTKIEGLGPKNIRRLYRELGVRNVVELKKAARTGRIRELKGFGERSESAILKGIEFLEKSQGRFVLGFVMPEVEKILGELRETDLASRLEAAGSTRRLKETIGDIDILAAVNPGRDFEKKSNRMMEAFVQLKEAVHVYERGSTRASVRLKFGLDADLRVIPSDIYGAALLYFTGSKDHNIVLRNRAIKRGWKLNEYGLFKGKKLLAGKTEEEIYRALGLEYIPPEMRENTGEIEAAAEGKIPRLIDYGDLKGDLQIQTDWTDGLNSMEDYASAAAKAGLDYIAITDHTKRLAMTGGLDERKLARQGRAIDELNRKLTQRKIRVKVLKGTEVDILKDGSLDLKDNALEKLDVVGASIHSYFNLPEEEQTDRLIRAMENKNVDIIFHPTGRIINEREPIRLDIDEIVKAARRTGTILEADAYPDRLDLKDEFIRKCVAAGVKLSVDSDSHEANQFKYLRFGIAQARRGWAKKSDVINAWPLQKALSFLKKN
jgi:DNA polymerase (family 10)